MLVSTLRSAWFFRKQLDGEFENTLDTAPSDGRPVTAQRQPANPDVGRSGDSYVDRAGLDPGLRVGSGHRYVRRSGLDVPPVFRTLAVRSGGVVEEVLLRRADQQGGAAADADPFAGGVVDRVIGRLDPLEQHHGVAEHAVLGIL
jgi:hypothetical protein